MLFIGLLFCVMFWLGVFKLVEEVLNYVRDVVRKEIGLVVVFKLVVIVLKFSKIRVGKIVRNIVVLMVVG